MNINGTISCSTIGSFDSSKKIIEQSGLCTSTKEKCSEKRDTVEKENVKIEDSAKRGKEDEKYIENEDDDTQDLDLQEYDNMIKCNSSDVHSLFPLYHVSLNIFLLYLYIIHFVQLFSLMNQTILL
jgi:hypothetical protein